MIFIVKKDGHEYLVVNKLTRTVKARRTKQSEA